ncbi:MAG: MATE family efflux transporter [Shimia sp.]
MTDAPPPLSRREAGRLASLALPIVVSLAAATLIGVVDTVMVAPLGTVPLAAVGVTGAVIVVAYAGLYGLVSIAGIHAAQGHGGGDPAIAGRAAAAGLWLGLAGGALAAAAMLAMRYALPALGQPDAVLAILAPYWTAMALSLIPFGAFYALKGVYEAVDLAWLGVAFAFVSVAVNVPANYLLIYVADLGLTGAGLASLLSELVGLALIVWHLRRARATRGLRGPGGDGDLGRSLRTQLRDGAPVAAGYAGEGIAGAVATLLIGLFGAVALAANQIVTSVAGVLYMLPLGMAAAVSIRVGQAMGAGERARLRPISVTALAIVSGWMLLVAGALAVFGGPIARALAPEPAVAGLAGTLFFVIAAMQLADGVQSTALGALRGLLDVRVPTLVTLGTYFVLALPAAWLLSVPFGPMGVWAGFGLGVALAGAILTVRLLRRTRV